MATYNKFTTDVLARETMARTKPGFNLALDNLAKQASDLAKIGERALALSSKPPKLANELLAKEIADFVEGLGGIAIAIEQMGLGVMNQASYIDNDMRKASLDVEAGTAPVSALLKSGYKPERLRSIGLNILALVSDFDKERDSRLVWMQEALNEGFTWLADYVSSLEKSGTLADNGVSGAISAIGKDLFVSAEPLQPIRAAVAAPVSKPDARKLAAALSMQASSLSMSMDADRQDPPKKPDKFVANVRHILLNMGEIATQLGDPVLASTVPKKISALANSLTPAPSAIVGDLFTSEFKTIIGKFRKAVDELTAAPGVKNLSASLASFEKVLSHAESKDVLKKGHAAKLKTIRSTMESTQESIIGSPIRANLAERTVQRQLAGILHTRPSLEEARKSEVRYAEISLKQVVDAAGGLATLKRKFNVASDVVDFLHQQLDKLMQKPEYRGVEIVTPESEFLDFADNNFEYELGLSALNRKVAGSKKKLMDLADAATTPEGTKALVAYAEKVLKAAGYSAHEVWSVVSAAKADAFDRSQGKTETKKTAKSAVFQKEAVTDVRDRLLMLRSLHEGTAAFDSMSVDDLKKLIDSMLKRISLGKDPKSGSLDDTAQKEIMVKVVQTMYAALGKRA